MPEHLLPENLDSAHDEALQIDRDAEQLRLQKEHAEQGFQELSLLASDERDFNFSIFADRPNFVENLQRTYERTVIPDSNLTIFVDPSVQTEKPEVVADFLNYLKSPELAGDVERMNQYLPDSYTAMSQIPTIFVHSAETLKKYKSEHESGGFVKHPPVNDLDREKKPNVNIIIHPEVEGLELRSVFVHELVHNCQPNNDLPSFKLFREGVATHVAQKVIGIDGNGAIIRHQTEGLEKFADHPFVKGLPHDQSGFSFNLLEIFTPEAQGLESSEPDEEEKMLFNFTRYLFVACFLDWCRSQPKNPNSRRFSKDQNLSFLTPLSRKTEESLVAFVIKVKNEAVGDYIANENLEDALHSLERYTDDLRLILSPFLNLVFGKDEVRYLARRARELREAKTEEELSERHNFYYRFTDRLYNGIRKIERDFNDYLDYLERRAKKMPWW